MMKQILSAVCGLLLGASQMAEAQSTQGVVVELYTSQGCSSCPPADHILSELAARPGVIALALHVDYWDYIGWADTFANPRFADRQRAYAKAAGDKMIYTPQMVIGGVARVVGAEGPAIDRAIEGAKARVSPVRLVVERHGDTLTIRAEADPPLTAPVFVQLVRYSPAEDVSIRHGENAGLEARYHNIVTSWERVGQWAGKAPLVLKADAPGDAPAVVILQREGPSEILAAARLD